MFAPSLLIIGSHNLEMHYGRSRIYEHCDFLQFHIWIIRVISRYIKSGAVPQSQWERQRDIVLGRRPHWLYLNATIHAGISQPEPSGDYLPDRRLTSWFRVFDLNSTFFSAAKFIVDLVLILCLQCVKFYLRFSICRRYDFCWSFCPAVLEPASVCLTGVFVLLWLVHILIKKY